MFGKSAFLYIAGANNIFITVDVYVFLVAYRNLVRDGRLGALCKTWIWQGSGFWCIKLY